MAVEPMLARVRDPAGWDRPGSGRLARVRFSDGRWHSATVLGWRHYDDRWYAHLRWPDGRCDWRAYDPRFMRSE